MTRRHLLVIHNPTAGRRRRRLGRVLDALTRAGLKVDVAPTQYAGHATTLAQAANGYDAVVAAGGDGTINEVANGLDGRPLGIIPLGTANVLAIELGYPWRAQAIARLLAEAGTLAAVPGRIGARRFVQMASAGFDARVVARLDLGLKRRLGKGAYVLTGGREIWGGDRRPVRVTVDGASYDASQAIISKGRHYGGRFVVAPWARLDRPSFQVALFLRRGAAAIPGYALSIALGRLGRRSDVRLLEAREILIDTPAGDPLQIDGDPFGRLPATITIDPTPLPLIAPSP